MASNLHETFIQLVRFGIGASKDATVYNDIDWQQLKNLADEQGLSAIVLDAIEALNINSPHDLARSPQKELPPLNIQLKLSWIGEVLNGESVYKHQQMVAVEMAKCFHHNAIRVYVLKGQVIAECYPKPDHRVSVDIDCYLLSENGNFDAWKEGNDLMRAKGFSVNTDFYKNSAFDISGVNVENHRYLTPFRGNKRLKKLERYLQDKLRKDSLGSRNCLKFKDTELCRPPVIVSALFLIEHAYSHFLHEGLTWRMVLDWQLFSRMHYEKIEWGEFNARIDEFGFRKFYDSFSRLGQYLMDRLSDERLEYRDIRMLKDIWTPLDLHETVRGWKGKLALAGNTWRAKWKYRYFTDMSWMTALWIQVKGFLFEKEPKLD